MFIFGTHKLPMALQLLVQCNKLMCDINKKSHLGSLRTGTATPSFLWRFSLLPSAQKISSIRFSCWANVPRWSKAHPHSLTPSPLKNTEISVLWAPGSDLADALNNLRHQIIWLNSLGKTPCTPQTSFSLVKCYLYQTRGLH